MSGPLRELTTALGAMADVLEDARPLGTAFAQLVTARRASGRNPSRDDLVHVREHIFAILRENQRWVAGAGLVTAPGLLAGSPYWLEWWWLRAGRTPEPLRVNLDESAADFFEYPSAEWYAKPSLSGRPHAAGPYVDHLCTNQYSVTLTLPVVEAGELLGVAGADVLVSSIEAMVLPALSRLGPQAALVTGAGRVIASVSPTLAPGLRINLDDVPTRPALPRRRQAIGGISDWLVTQSRASAPS